MTSNSQHPEPPPQQGTTVRVTRLTAQRLAELAERLERLDRLESELMGQRLPLPSWTADNALLWCLQYAMRAVERAEVRAGKDLAEKHATGVAPRRRPRYTQ